MSVRYADVGSETTDNLVNDETVHVHNRPQTEHHIVVCPTRHDADEIDMDDTSSDTDEMLLSERLKRIKIEMV